MKLELPSLVSGPPQKVQKTATRGTRANPIKLVKPTISQEAKTQVVVVAVVAAAAAAVAVATARW